MTNTNMTSRRDCFYVLQIMNFRSRRNSGNGRNYYFSLILMSIEIMPHGWAKPISAISAISAGQKK